MATGGAKWLKKQRDKCSDIQFDINTKLRKELDEKNTKIAVLSLLRCRKLKCIDREPPYGSEVEKEAANEQ